MRYIIELLLYSFLLLLFVYINRHKIMYNMSFMMDEQSYVSFYESINKIHHWGYLTVLFNLYIRCFGGALCVFIGGIFIPSFSKLNYWTSCKLLIRVQWVLILVFVITYVSYWITDSYSRLQADLSLGNDYLLSVLFRSDSLLQLWQLPIMFIMQSINLFQLIYLMLLAVYISKETSNKYFPSFWFVLRTYGVGYLFFNLLIMFLVFAFIV